MIVDADNTARRLCRAVLEDLGFSVQEFDRGVAAISAVRGRVPSLIVLGQQLRDVSGREAGEWLQSMPMLRMTPVVVVGSGAESDFQLTKMPYAVYLRSPVSAGSLRRSMGTIRKK